MGCLGFIGYFIRIGSCGGAILNNPNAGEWGWTKVGFEILYLGHP